MNEVEYLLQKLGEEASEVIKETSKCNCFGADDHDPREPDGPTNAGRLVDELNDMHAVIELLIQKGVIPKDWLDLNKIKDKMVKKTQFMAYSLERGTLHLE